MGARIIEKHFTLDKNLSSFRDHQLSADPAELGELVCRIRLIEIMRGKGGKKVLDAERANIDAVRRGAYAARDLSAGTRISSADLIYLRPRTGLSPAEIERRLGSPLKKPLKSGEPVTAEHFV
jgi:sialic acid synthase SpsE